MNKRAPDPSGPTRPASVVQIKLNAKQIGNFLGAPLISDGSPGPAAADLTEHKGA